MKKVFFSLMAMLVLTFSVNAQSSELTAEWNSKERTKRLKKMSEMLNKQPANCNIASVDGAVETSTKLMKLTAETNTLLDASMKSSESKLSLTDLIDLSKSMVETGLSLVDLGKDLSNASNDVKSASPQDAIPATKSVSYCTNAVNILTPELKLQTEVVNALIEKTKTQE